LNEHELDASRAWKPFGSHNVKNAERLPALALALCGRTADGLRQQLLVSAPKLPRGYTLADLQVLEKQARLMIKNPAAFPKLAAQVIVIGSQTFSGLEARCEVVRRAIEHLDKHR